ncbi:MAG: hypothetical protein J7641_00215 [Cyanobacteria bacterium SID2]|nr:hypothetical protein [Cyanobacteria bacterium SID2]MBP0005788.1 hypothetical protein [Cyanobacteria bacterium SBC]
MARYTALFVVAAPVQHVRQALPDLLKACNFEPIYQTADYVMARETPGRVSYAKLVTVEVLIDVPIDNDREVRLNFVVKNEELPLQINNHCQEMFESVKTSVSDSQQWQLLETVAG